MTVLVTEGPGLTAVVDPLRGGKVISLRSSDGWEWLAQPDAEQVPGSAFVDAEMAGWDECAPSIVECEVDGVRIPDHGDLWNTEFEVLDDRTVRGQGNGYLLERRITATDAGLRFDYRVVSNRPMPFLWAAHPQFRAPTGTEVRLPSSALDVVDVQQEPPHPLRWDSTLATIDSLRAGDARKVYVDPDAPVSSASIVLATGSTLEMTWSAECPYVGIWFDNAAFSRESVIAIEPSTGYFDSLARANEGGRVARLSPGEPFMWSVELGYRSGIVELPLPR